MNFVLSIQSLNREHLGFALLEFPAEADDPGTSDGVCIIDLFPIHAEPAESSGTDLLYRYHFRESGEHRARQTKTSAGCIFEITPRSDPRLRIELTATGQGTITQGPDYSTPIAHVFSTHSVPITDGQLAHSA